MIIKIDEIVPQSLTKNEPSDRNQSEADIKGRESPRRAVFYRTVGQPECVLPGYAFILALAHVRQNSLRQSSNDQRPIHMTCALLLGVMCFRCGDDYHFVRASCGLSLCPHIYHELIAGRVLSDRQISAIEHKIFLEALRHVGLPLHGSCDCSLLGYGDRFRKPATLRISSC